MTRTFLLGLCLALISLSTAIPTTTKTTKTTHTRHQLVSHQNRDRIGGPPTTIRGVNLGGWLMMEPWITPSIFETANHCQPDWNGTYIVVDEWTYWQYGPRCTTVDIKALIKQHWDEWVSEDHMKALSAAQITHLRIPFGYWYFNTTQDEPFAEFTDVFPYALERLKLVCNQWAKQYGLSVLFDLHGAPGSQNGFDNSGRRGPIRVLEGNNLQRTKQILAQVSTWVEENIDLSVVFGIEAVNEPFTFGDTGDAVWSAMHDDYYPSAYTEIRAAFGQQFFPNVVLQCAFKPVSAFDGYMPASEGYYNVWLDDHNYQCFGDFPTWAYGSDGWSKHLKLGCSNNASYVNAPLWTFVGEFSLAVTDCTKWLDGIGNTPRPIRDNRTDVCDYYNQPVDTFPQEYKDFLNQYARVQMDAFEQGAGWFFWNFRTENSPEWDFLLGLEKGWIPANVAKRDPYPCSSLEDE